MKKKYNNYGKAVVVTLLLTIAFGVFPLSGNAQENDPPLFALVECMKVKPKNDESYLEIEKNIWKPLYLERAKQGDIVGWTLYKVRNAGTDNAYNYVTVTLSSNPENLKDPWKKIDMARVLPGKDLDAAIKETDKSRDMVSSFVISSLASVYSKGGPGDFKYIQVDYMKVEPGKENEYKDIEINIWKAVHHEFIKAGSRVGWSFWDRGFQGDAGLDYQYITVNYMEDRSKNDDANYTEAISKAHPGKDVDAMLKRTEDSRVLVKSEWWDVVDRAFAQ